MRLFKAGNIQRLSSKTPLMRSELYIRAQIYNDSGALMQTETLTHINDGLYGSEISPALPVGQYDVSYSAFKDVGLTKKFTPFFGYSEFLRVEDIEGGIQDTLDLITDQIDDNDAQVN